MQQNEKDSVDIILPKEASEAVKAAYEKALDAGQIVLVAADGNLIRVNPNRSTEVVRALPVRFKVKKGQQIKLH